MFRPCLGCTECCTGKLLGNQYGNEMYPGHRCVFLVTNRCSIYATRPDSCSKYFCAWAQGLLPDWMKPNKCGIMVSVEIDKDGKQFLKVEGEPSVEVKAYLEQWTKKNGTYLVQLQIQATG